MQQFSHLDSLEDQVERYKQVLDVMPAGVILLDTLRISEHSEQPFRYDPNTYFGLIRTHIPRLSEHF